MKLTNTVFFFLICRIVLAQAPVLKEAEKSMADGIGFDHEVLLMLRTQTQAEFIEIPKDDTHSAPAVAVRLGHFDAPVVLKDLKNRLIFKGYLLFLSDNGNTSTDGLHELRLLKEQDPLEPIRYMGTSSDEPARTTNEIYEKVQEWHGYKGCTVVGAGENWLELKFVLPLEETEELAQDIIDFCPKILNFNGDKEYLANDLKDMPKLYLEW